jgi:hypothetical protein
MKLTLIRNKFLHDRTLGKLHIDGEYFCETLEDAKRDRKIAGETCIKAGEYSLIVDMSKSFGRILPLLQNVPEFSGVRIHAGNTPADTQGCILVGKYIDENNDLRISRIFENQLVDVLHKNKGLHSIKIIEDDEANKRR